MTLPPARLVPPAVLLICLIGSYADLPSSVYLRCRCVALLDVLRSTPGYPRAGGAPRCRLGLPSNASRRYASAEIPLDTDGLLKKMEKAYAGMDDYSTRVEVRTVAGAGSSEMEKFLYTFKKPNWIRLDFESPHKGMILVYPDKNGKVTVRPAGLAHFLKLHLAPDSRLLKGSSGQRIDQTDLGLLIKNIGRSLTDQRRGPVEITEEDGYVLIRVLAADHFREDVVTLYQFFIDKRLWLPAKVKERTPDGQLERSITFEDLRTNNGVLDSFFQLDEATNQSDERSNEK